MTIALRQQSHIVVADPRPHDYRELTAMASDHGWHVHLLTSGHATLRQVRTTPAELWMISVQLPDMSGFDLFEMLRDQVATARVFIVDDEYDADHERQAYRCGAALYLCKDLRGSIDCGGLLGFPVRERPPQPGVDIKTPSNDLRVQEFQDISN